MIWKLAWILILCPVCWVGDGAAQQISEKIHLNAFGDMSYGLPFGGAADEEAAELFEQYGNTETSIHDGFGIFGLDMLMTNYLTDDVTLQFETQIEIEGQGEVEVDVERLFLDFRFNEWINLQAGGFFTPIGYFNRNLYSRSWLMYQVQRPELFEEELGGFVPTHMVGVHLYGAAPMAAGHLLNYSFSVGNGAAPTPSGRVYKEDGPGVQVTGLAEWVVPSYKDFRIGLSGWIDKINSLKLDELGESGEWGEEAEGDEEGEEGEEIELREVGFNPYISYFGKKFNFNIEYVFLQQKDLLGNLAAPTYDLSGVGVEFSLNLYRRKVHPYIRYDIIDQPPGGGPYFPIRTSELDDDLLVRTYLPEVERFMLGVAYDYNLHVRLKFEYARNMVGFRKANQLVWQAAYAF